MKEKNSSFSNVIENLRKSYNSSLPDVQTAGTVKKLPLSSPKLNYILGGGFPIGRIIEFFGSESSGKTVLASYIGGQVQNRTDGGNKTVIFVDMEHTFDINYAKVAGLNMDEDRLIFIQPDNGEQGFTICQKLVETEKIGLIVWDSVAATPSAASIQDEFGKASFGATAKLFSEGLRKFNPYLSKCGTSLILLNQVRAKIGGFSKYGPAETTSGGYAIKFYASWRGRLSKVEDILDKKEVIGNSMMIRNVKSKIGFPKRSAELNLYYSTGFNPDAEYVDFIIDLGLVTVRGAWYSNEEWGFKGQGKNSLLEFLYSHREIFEVAKTEVNKAFTQHTFLDDREEDDPEAEEEAALLDSEPGEE